MCTNATNSTSIIITQLVYPFIAVIENIKSSSVHWRNIMLYLALVSILDLSFNSITRLQVENFHGLEHLVELNLSHNKIDSMTSEVFHYLSVSITTTSTFE